MSELARVAAEWHGDVPVGVVTGEVDASNVAEVGVALRGLVTNRSSVLIVDLSPTTYLDSAGINLMFALGDELGARQLQLRLVIAPGSSIASPASAPTWPPPTACSISDGDHDARATEGSGS